MIRPLRLTDPLKLLFLAGKTPPNEARTAERLSGEGRRAAIELLNRWLPLVEERQGLVYERSGLIGGLVSARSRRGPHAWEIDHLRSPQDPDICIDLLEKAAFLVGDLGAGKLFLSLDERSPLVESAKRAGFGQYDTRYLYRFDGKVRGKGLPPTNLRPRADSDEHGLFRVYTAALPPAVRSAVGMTLQEWRQCRERDAQREMVCEQDGRLESWLKVRRDGKAGLFEIVSQPGEADLDQMVDYGLRLLHKKRPVYCQTSESQGELRRLLEERGFAEAARHSCLVEHLAARIREPILAPLNAPGA
ncbi:hypothetical protein ACFLX5_02690 [Chloroflexota bacterium]